MEVLASDCLALCGQHREPRPGLGVTNPPLRYTRLADVLYHEIGHHIHAVHRPVYEGEENVAEDRSRKLRGRFLRRRYWWLMPILYPLSFATKLVDE